MNKKSIIITAILVIFLILAIIFNNKNTNNFKNEYESLNSNTKYKEITIPKDNTIVYTDYKQLFNILDNTGIIFLCHPKSNYCRSAAEALVKASEETGVEKIYYMNNSKDRDIKSLKEGKIITEKESTDNYNKLLEKLGENASIYEKLNDKKIKRIYYPTLISVKSGKIVDYITDSNENKNLTKTDQTKLKQKYIDAINKTLVCDDSTKDKC